MLVGCAKTPEEKVNALVKEAVQKTLVKPDSYDPVETQMDSVYAPIDEVLNLAVALAKESRELELNELTMKQSKSSMAIWSGPYSSAFGRNEYSDAKQEYEEAKAKFDKSKKKCDELTEKLKAIYHNDKKEFMGYYAQQKFRYTDNSGETNFGTYLFYLDKDLTKVIASYNCEDLELLAAMAKIAEMSDELGIDLQP